MKCTIPEISWHNREPVLSVDINPSSNDAYRLATSGADSHVLIWLMSLSDNGAVKQELVSDLTKHQRAVNVVRWSNSGQFLASADDDANIIIWQQKVDNLPTLEDDTGDKETWIVYKILRGHKEDIYDLCWSVDGLKLLSGSIDNTAILWDFTKGRMDRILSDHKGFVQGVAWDPKDEFIATIGTDRTCRIFTANGKQTKARIHKGTLPVPFHHPMSNKEAKYFHNDTFKSFFRRLQFSPDGSLLVVPSGHIETDDCKKPRDATLVFALDNLREPVAMLPLANQSSTVVRFCPRLFRLREDGPQPVVDLPYRMVFAVGTDHDVVLYDTQQASPFARFQAVHYTRLTDLAWSTDGRLLMASSTDGFCSLITFEDQELGVEYVREDSEAVETAMEVSGCEEIDARVDEKDVEKKRPSFLEQWAIKAPKRAKLDRPGQVERVVVDEEDCRELSSEIRKEIKELMPRRADSKVDSVGVHGGSSVAKAIAVRRKPRSEEADKGAKPIEVRRQPRVPTNTDSKENDPVNRVPADTLAPNVMKPDHNDFVQKKDGNEETAQSNEAIEVKDAYEGRLSGNKEKTKAKTKNRKTEETTKIKVPSLIKKSTPQKNNPLLKFLKNSAEKKRSIGKDAPTVIDLTLVVEEAQDAWKCGKETNGQANKLDEHSKSEAIEEDCTEDFCLQLEDSQECGKVESKQIEEKLQPQINSGKDEEDNKNNVRLETTTKCVKTSTDEIVSNKIPSAGQKVPRRVALITLASPKGKKKS